MSEIDQLTEALSPTCRECGDEISTAVELKYRICGICMILETQDWGD